MGGLGSGYPMWKDRKTTVEECSRLPIKYFTDNNIIGPERWASGTLYWKKPSTGETTSSLGYEVDTRNMAQPRIRLRYTITWRRSGEKEDLDYWVGLQTTPCNFGGVRWWFTCPLASRRAYNRRCGVLYLPPGQKYYGSREGYDLTYQSAQEAHQFDSLYASIAAEMGCSMKDVKRLLNR